MFKFRTLVPGAEHLIGGQLLDHRHALKTRTGEFLRETRLDELPQLFNVLRGDMTFFGPRPVRPEVYAESCRTISGYDIRFRVKPGLVGYSQLFTPHGAPKRLRSWIDNRSVLHPPSARKQVGLVVFTAFVVLRTVLCRALSKLLALARPWGRRDRRRLRRVRGPRATVRCHSSSSGGTESIGRLVDINERSFRLRCNGPLPAESLGDARLRIEASRPFRNQRVMDARCRVTPRGCRTRGGLVDHVFEYEPASENSRYVIDQYLLGKSVV